MLRKFPRYTAWISHIPNWIGSRESHEAVYRHLLSTGGAGQVYLVLEDDVTLPEDIEGVLGTALRERAPADWDLVRFSCWGRRFSTPVLDNVTADGSVFRTQPELFFSHKDNNDNKYWFAGGAHAVALRYEALPRMLKQLARLDDVSIDASISSFPWDSVRAYCMDEPTVSADFPS